MSDAQGLMRRTCKIGAIGALSAAFACSSFAQDSDRTLQLEREIQEIKIRLSRLESAQAGASSSQPPIAAADGWKSVLSWRQLKNGMSYQDVRGILGEPSRIDGGTLATWYYPNRGYLVFFQDKLDRWTEPR